MMYLKTSTENNVKASQISQVLTAMGIANFLDSCNPDYTVHITESAVLIDADNTDGPWYVLNRNGDPIRFNSESELVEIYKHK